MREAATLWGAASLTGWVNETLGGRLHLSSTRGSCFFNEEPQKLRQNHSLYARADPGEDGRAR